MTTKVRNEMIHYKKTFIGDGSGIPNFKLGGKEVAIFFRKSNMEYIKNGFIDLCQLIADALGLAICKDIEIFETDGRDGLVNYIYDSNLITFDDSRFDSDDE